MARLRRLHGAAVHLAHTAPEIIANPDAARGLETALAEAFVDCLATGRPRAESAVLRRHGAIMKRFRDVVEERPGEPLYLAEVCEALGVTRRTLHLCCHEHLGIGPKRYLTLRRLHLAREALRLGSLGETSVTDIATQFGFWELGRFAVAYRSVFGQTPSATLRSPPG
jgi:AraC-like DNA-binding protein